MRVKKENTRLIKVEFMEGTDELTQKTNENSQRPLN